MSQQQTRVLVSPAGMSPGALYSALMHLRPSRLVVITSGAAAPGVSQAIAAYARDGRCPPPKTRIFELRDAIGGFVEAASVARSVRETLPPDGDGVVVNVTGGSTALQFAVLYVAVPLTGARLFAVTDERPREQQLANPFVRGTLVEVPRPDVS